MVNIENYEKRYQVFVSSTFTDLKDERHEVIRALLELDCIPVGMELFPASDDDAWTLIKRVIDQSDYYIVMSAGRYGSTHPETGVSYTEMEFDYAEEIGIPILAFLHSDLTSIALDKSEQDGDARKRLSDFREKLRRRVTRDWTTAAELGSVVSRSIVKMIRLRPGIGWIRANNPIPVEVRLQIATLEKELQEKSLIIERMGNYKRTPDDEFIDLFGENLNLSFSLIDKDGHKRPYAHSANFISRKDACREILALCAEPLGYKEILSGLISSFDTQYREVKEQARREMQSDTVEVNFINSHGEVLDQLWYLHSRGLISVDFEGHPENELSSAKWSCI